jgi:sulfoacetaldehyde acetyltransferase
MRTVAKADVIVALGCRMGPFGKLPQYDMVYWPKDAKVIQVDVNPEVLGASLKLEVASCADVKEYTPELLAAIKALKPDLNPNKERLADVEKENKIWDDEKEEWSSSTDKLMHPRRFLRELTAAIPMVLLSLPTSAITLP